MIITVDVASGVPPWRQVHDQIVALVAMGQLPVGAKLPTIRQLARDLGLAAGTVARAYRELEVIGVLRTGRRQGTEVAGRPSADPLAVLTAEYVRAARALGAGDPAIIDSVGRALGVD